LRLRRLAFTLSTFLVACSSSRTEDVSEGSFVIRKTRIDALGHYSHVADVTAAGRTLGRFVQQYTVNPYDGRHIIWASSCVDDGVRADPNTLPPCGVFWHDAGRGTQVSIEYRPGWSSFLVNVPLAGYTDAPAEVWSPDGQYAALQTRRDLYFLNLKTGLIKRLSSLNQDARDQSPESGGDHASRTRGVIWDRHIARTITARGNETAREINVRALFDQ